MMIPDFNILSEHIVRSLAFVTYDTYQAILARLQIYSLDIISILTTQNYISNLVVSMREAHPLH